MVTAWLEVWACCSQFYFYSSYGALYIFKGPPVTYYPPVQTTHPRSHTQYVRHTHKYPDSLNLMVIRAIGMVSAPNDCSTYLKFPKINLLSSLGTNLGSFNSANIYRAPTVCRAQMDVGAKGNIPGGRKCTSSVLLKRRLCLLVSRRMWGKGGEGHI